MERDNASRTRITIQFHEMTNLDEDVIVSCIAKKKLALANLKEVLLDRFSSFSEPIFKNMSWVDPRKWEDALGYGSQQIVEFSRYFEEPLSAAGFDTRLVQKEWRQFRNFARAHYNGLDVH